MPAWITTYLKETVTLLTSDAIERGIASADWWTLGEAVGLEEDAVDAFMDQLSWNDEPLEFTVETDRRPVQFWVLTDLADIKEEIEELVAESDIKIPPSVEERLADVCSIVAIELGWSQLQTMYEVVAFEIAYWLAETFNGVIRSGLSTSFVSGLRCDGYGDAFATDFVHYSFYA